MKTRWKSQLNTWITTQHSGIRTPLEYAEAMKHAKYTCLSHYFDTHWRHMLFLFSYLDKTMVGKQRLEISVQNPCVACPAWTTNLWWWPVHEIAFFFVDKKFQNVWGAVIRWIGLQCSSYLPSYFWLVLKLHLKHSKYSLWCLHKCLSLCLAWIISPVAEG